MKRYRWLILVGVLMSGGFATEYISHRRVNPTGRVSNLDEYLAWRPSAGRFAQVDVNGKSHTIAYGPMSSWLLLSSGPSAYVFDETGRLVDWSSDIGDDPQFGDRWSAQRALASARTLSRDEVRKLAPAADGSSRTAD